MKIIDTCTLINIFSSLDFDLSPYLEEYHVVITNHVVSEYTRKIPRQIPSCVSVIGMSEAGEILIGDLESLFPQLGIGERSIFVLALEAASVGFRPVVLSDDRNAVRRFSEVAKSKSVTSEFSGSENIIWGNTMSLITKLADEGKISEEYVKHARRILGL